MFCVPMYCYCFATVRKCVSFIVILGLFLLPILHFIGTAMMSTLKPHLLFEMSDLLVDVALRQVCSDRCNWRPLAPKDVCALALSSPYGFKMVAYLLRNHLTSVLRDDEDLLFNHPNRGNFPLHFRMSQRYHIDVLLRMAGEYCTAMSNSNYGFYYTPDWQKPLYDGFSANEIITSSVAFRDGNVFHAVAQNRKVHDEIVCPMLPIGLPLQLTFASDAVIKNLIITTLDPKVDNQSAFAAWKNLKIERIEFCGFGGPFINRDIFHPHSPQMAHLKCLIIDHRIYVEAVTLMLEEHHGFNEVVVSNVNFEQRFNFRSQYSSPKKYLFYIRTKVEALWEAIVNHPGNKISVVCWMLITESRSFAEWAPHCIEILPSDFGVSHSFSRGRATLTRTSGLKKMTVTLL